MFGEENCEFHFGNELEVPVRSRWRGPLAVGPSWVWIVSEKSGFG